MVVVMMVVVVVAVIVVTRKFPWKVVVHFAPLFDHVPEQKMNNFPLDHW